MSVPSFKYVPACTGVGQVGTSAYLGKVDVVPAHQSLGSCLWQASASPWPPSLGYGEDIGSRMLD